MCTHYSAEALLRPKLQKRTRWGGDRGMAMCVHETDREKLGDRRGERVQDGREKVRKSRGEKESIVWERE